jgi:hypothetical protein
VITREHGGNALDLVGMWGHCGDTCGDGHSTVIVPRNNSVPTVPTEIHCSKATQAVQTQTQSLARTQRDVVRVLRNQYARFPKTVGTVGTGPLFPHNDAEKAVPTPAPTVSPQPHAISPEVAPMAIEINCRRCGQPFTPTTEALRKGPPTWWYCPARRPAEKRDSEVAE